MILFIDTNGANHTITLFKQNIILKSYTWAIKKDKRQDVLVMIEKLLTSCKVEKKDLCGILVYQGPGSFTSVRVGVTIANALAWSLNIPVYGVKSNNYNEKIPDLTIKNKLDELIKNNKKLHFSLPVEPYYETSLR